MNIIKFIPGLAVAVAMICMPSAQAAQPARGRTDKLQEEMRQL
jgi:hypothetical protein